MCSVAILEGYQNISPALRYVGDDVKLRQQSLGVEILSEKLITLRGLL